MGADIPWRLRHAWRTLMSPPDVAPFEINTDVRVQDALVVPDFAGTDPLCSAAVYALPDGSEPTWFQLQCATKKVKKDADGLENARAARLEPSPRPEVNWIRVGGSFL